MSDEKNGIRLMTLRAAPRNKKELYDNIRKIIVSFGELSRMCDESEKIPTDEMILHFFEEWSDLVLATRDSSRDQDLMIHKLEFMEEIKDGDLFYPSEEEKEAYRKADEEAYREMIRFEYDELDKD